MRFLKVALTALALLLVAIGFGGYGLLRGWHVTRLAPAALTSLLEPSYEYGQPPGPGPFPTVLQFHACGGLFENQRRWARSFEAAGWATVLVDSNGPRDLDHDDVCGGLALHGGERSGDVLVTLAHARSLPFVDPERIVLAGWSHGAWSVMELLAMDPPAALPHNLLESPDGGLSGVVGTLLIYPYCGPGARPPVWLQPIASLFVFAAGDTIAPPRQCQYLVDGLRSAARAPDVLTLEGVNHAFDEQIHVPGGKLVYDAAATDRAHRRAAHFLGTLGSEPP